MLPKERIRVISALIALISFFSSAVLANENIDVARSARLARVRELYSAIEGPAREPPRTFRTKEGYLRFLSAPPLSHFPGTSGGGATAKDSADAFLKR